MKTKLRGIELELSQKDVHQASLATPEGWGRKYAVEVNARYYPPKDLLLSLLDKKTGGSLLRLDFTTEDAVRILRRLGFKILPKRAESMPGTARLSSLAGLLSLGGDSLQDAERYDE